LQEHEFSTSIADFAYGILRHVVIAGAGHQNKASIILPVRLTRVTQESHAVKRRFARVALPKGMLVAWQHSGSRSVSRISTLGLGGLFITTPDPVPVGSVVKIVFDVPGGEVRARAIVKNIKAGKGMAIAFIEMGYECRARLDQLLKKLA
jgi:PilZ domain